MANRIRTQTAVGLQGFKQLRPLHDQPQPHHGFRRVDRIEDVVSQEDGKYLQIDHIECEGGAITKNWPGSQGNSFKDYVCDSLVDPYGAYYEHWLIPGRPTDNQLAVELLAKTNPSRATFDWPTFIGELRDFPRMLKAEGDSFLRTAAHWNLALQFGWGPLVRDLTNMAGFHREVHKRNQEVEHLRESGLRRKRNLWSGVRNSTNTNAIIQSVGGIHRGDYSGVTRERTWGFVRWFPGELPPRGSFDMTRMLNHAVNGMALSDNYTLASNAWELLPWSWFIDYTTNIGDYLNAHRNSIPATHGPIQIMRLTETTGILPEVVYSDGIRTKWTGKRTTKRRIPVSSVHPEVHLPYLSWGQLSILGSIGVTRRSGNSRGLSRG